MYVVICYEDSQKVKEIIKNPNDEQKSKGRVIESLKEPEQFTEIDGELYFIKKKENEL